MRRIRPLAVSPFRRFGPSPVAHSLHAIHAPRCYTLPRSRRNGVQAPMYPPTGAGQGSWCPRVQVLRPDHGRLRGGAADQQRHRREGDEPRPVPIGPLTLGPWATDGATLLFPLSYIFGDILTEVYGYARSRRVISGRIRCCRARLARLHHRRGVATGGGMAEPGGLPGCAGPGAPFRGGRIGRLRAGEFCNSFVLAPIKILTEGRFLWVRTIGSKTTSSARGSIPASSSSSASLAQSRRA